MLDKMASQGQVKGKTMAEDLLSDEDWGPNSDTRCPHLTVARTEALLKGLSEQMALLN